MRKLLERFIRGDRLNRFSGDELRFVHLVLCRMYDLCLNILLYREANVNAGCRDDPILSRKVTPCYWLALYDALARSGVREEDLLDETRRAQLCLALNSDAEALRALTRHVMRNLGLRSCPRIAVNNLYDGNYLFSLGGVLPSRCLMALAACLKFWGMTEHEPLVRHFTGKFFVLYLMVSGIIGLRKTALLEAARNSYAGIFETIIGDVAATWGISKREFSESEIIGADEQNRVTNKESLFSFFVCGGR